MRGTPKIIEFASNKYGISTITNRAPYPIYHCHKLLLVLLSRQNWTRIAQSCKCMSGMRAVRLMVASTTLDCMSRTLGTRISFFRTTLLSASRSLP